MEVDRAMEMVRPDFHSIPPELKSEPRWVVWKGAKVPYNASALNSKASVTLPDTWSSFAQAEVAYDEGGYLGVGFVLNGDGIVGIDLDKCVEDGIPDPEAMRILDELGCGYVEVSPTGTGLHGLGYGERVPGCRGQLQGINIEIYADKRYLTVTGKKLADGHLAPLRGLSNLANLVRSRHLQKSTEDLGSHLLSSSVGGIPLSSSVGIPRRTLPAHIGERNKCLFEFARHLKTSHPGASREELRPIVRAWHEKALSVIGTKEFAVTFADFMNGWIHVKQPFGATMRSIVNGIDFGIPLPSGIERLGYGTKALHLVRLCMALQAHQGDKEFFLSARKAGETLDIHFTDASKMLSTLVADGVLTLISKGVGMRASRYRMVVPNKVARSSWSAYRG